MKKRTVITTEKREVWVIRQPSGETKEFEMDGDGSVPVAEVLRLALAEAETDEPREESTEV